MCNTVHIMLFYIYCLLKGGQRAFVLSCFLRERNHSMKTVIESILAAEQKANSLIEQAQTSLTQKKAEAEAEANRIIAEAKTQAAEVIHQSVEQAKKQAAEFLEAVQQEREKKHAVQFSQLEPVIEQAVKKAVHIVCTSVLDHPKS